MKENDNQTDQANKPREVGRSSRRTALQALTFGGVAAAGALAGGGAVAARAGSSSDDPSTMTVDCALLGETFKEVIYDNDDPTDLRGGTFYTEGLLYPGNSIPDGEGFLPTTEGSIGHWICHGNFISHPGRPEPHIMSSQEYIFGKISEEDLVPSNMITSMGLEGMERLFYPMVRSVTGGTGDYLGASGEIVQMYTGTNSTVMLGDAAPNIRFEFTLL